MEQIVRAADARGMVAIVGLFYQHAATLPTATAYRQAVRTVTSKLKPYRNVVINIANENNSYGWDDTASIYDMRSTAQLTALMDEVHAVDPARLVGGGGYDRTKNRDIGLSAKADLLLYDTVSTQRVQELDFDDFRSQGTTAKPVVNVEQFGGWTSQFTPRGVFSDSLKAEYYREIDSAQRRAGLYTVFHNGPWMQVEPMRYDLAGYGTSTSPGVRWYFERVRAVRGL